MGIIYLNSYLAKINVIRSKMCLCKMKIEIIYYFLFYYPLWIKFRRSIKNLNYKYNK